MDKKAEEIKAEVEELLEKYNPRWKIYSEEEYNKFKDSSTHLVFIRDDDFLSTKTLSHLKKGQKLRPYSTHRKELSLYNLKLHLTMYLPHIEIAKGEIYRGKNTKINLICKKHNKNFMKTPESIRGVNYGCPQCAREATSGENHYGWNPNLTDEDRQGRTYIPFYRGFLADVLYWGSYTCVCCLRYGLGRQNPLNVHHLDGWNWCIEGRMDMKNTVVLCKECHDEFHSMFGYGNNTKQQFIDFINHTSSYLRMCYGTEEYEDPYLDF